MDNQPGTFGIIEIVSTDASASSADVQPRVPTFFRPWAHTANQVELSLAADPSTHSPSIPQPSTPVILARTVNQPSTGRRTGLIDGCGKFSELHNYFHCDLKLILTILTLKLTK